MNDVLPDLLDHGLILVFCGTAASGFSARVGAYYANPTNAFWPTLHATGMTPRRFNPMEYRELLGLKIGLTDLAKSSAGPDSILRRRDFLRHRLGSSIENYRPQILAFTSKAAWRGWLGLSSADAVAYGWQAGSLGETKFYVLPSPSGAARGYWDQEPWQTLADDYARRMNMS